MASRRLTKAEMLRAARTFGRRGGKARKAALSPKRRSEIARHAVQARWAKKRKGKS